MYYFVAWTLNVLRRSSQNQSFILIDCFTHRFGSVQLSLGALCTFAFVLWNTNQMPRSRTISNQHSTSNTDFIFIHFHLLSLHSEVQINFPHINYTSNNSHYASLLLLFILLFCSIWQTKTTRFIFKWNSISHIQMIPFCYYYYYYFFMSPAQHHLHFALKNHTPFYCFCLFSFLKFVRNNLAGTSSEIVIQLHKNE